MLSRSRIKRVLRRGVRIGTLIAILVLAFALRTYDINWDQNRNLHPDERYIAVLGGMLQPPRTLTEYFDAARSPLNPFNTEWGRNYVYGTLPLFLGRYLGEFFDLGCAEKPVFLSLALARLIFGDAADGCRPGHFTGYSMLTLVGRFMSALADTLTVLVVFAIGLQAFGWRVGLLAAAFSAFTVLHIQQAHFFTVDATATFFVTLSVWLSVRIAGLRLGDGLRMRLFLAQMLLAGATGGLALASKISTWPVALLIALAVSIALARARKITPRILLMVSLGILLAGTAMFAAFRVAQPYAFIGASEQEHQQTLLLCSPHADSLLSRACAVGAQLPEPLRMLFAPSGRWIQQVHLAQALVNGTIDAPFGIQWADRLPIVFPLINLVFWGMGLPLGVAALAGVADAMRHIWSGRRWWAHVLLLAWALGYFLYQGTQWTKSIRYLLPIYPALSVLAAQVLIRCWRALPSGYLASRRSLLLRVIAVAPLVLTLSGTVVWARAFMHIYDGEITRVQASRWVYDNVPTAVTLEWEHDGKAQRLQLPVREIFLADDSLPFSFLLRLSQQAGKPDHQIRAPRLRLNYLEGRGVVDVEIFDVLTNKLIARARAIVDSEQPVLNLADASLYPSHDYLVSLRLVEGGPLSARTSVIANEHWDDAVPQPLDGRNPYSDYYRGLSTSSDGQMQNYNDDTPEKLAQLLDWLDEADYLVLSSNRLYASIPRLPWRYPMTVRYYRALMSGELGFELVADFHAFPRLGPFVFNDQEMPQVLVRSPRVQGTPLGVEVPYPPAEEAFSVYDHPRVLIFRKSENYTRANAEHILGAADFALFMRRSPLESVNTPNGLLLDDKTWQAQQKGGTWRELFPPGLLLNHSPVLAVLAWLALVQVLGAAGFMLLFSSFRIGGDSCAAIGVAAYSLGKVLGLLLPAWIVWLLASLRIAPFTTHVVWGVMLSFVALGFAVGHLRRLAILTSIRTHWPLLLAGEGMYLAAFVFFLAIRIGNPDLWHPYMGGEKPMDFAYLNAVLKSTWFPPYDPWFAGGYINYYYFGWVIIGAVIKALGIEPAQAYNLAIPLLFALTASGAFAAGATAFTTLRRSVPAWQTLVMAGVTSAVFAVFLGNWGEWDVLAEAWKRLGGADQGTPEPIAIAVGALRWLNGMPLPIYPNWPYWNPTRPSPEVWIAEFPLFTFLYADLHAHMMAMPLVYLAVTLALAYAAGLGTWFSLLLGAINVGALWATNSWDYPTFLLLSLAGLLLGKMQDPQAGKHSAVHALARALPLMAAFVALTRVAVLPYVAHYGSAYNAIDRWEGERTHIRTFITIYGLFLVPLAFLGLRLLLRWDSRWTWWILGIGALVGALSAVIGATPIAAIAVPMLSIGVAQFLDARTGGARLLWTMAMGAWLLTLLVEQFVLRGDIARMNTVFKLYIQAWLLLAVVSGVATTWLVLAWLRRRLVKPVLRIGFVGALAVALGLAALYPLFAIPAKINDRYTHEAPTGLDGMAFMRHAQRVEVVGEEAVSFPLRHDYEAIRWMQMNVDGSPTILEGTTGGDLYRWGNRYSIYTGLPAVIGWQWHQRQQRAALQNDRVIYRRDDDVRLFYSSPDAAFAKQVLERYRPAYVIVGPLERAYYGDNGLAKFEQLVAEGVLSPVYRNEGVTIYRTRY
ncbi:MAG: DUF2298 domain-containing protein [Anaerolineae bacterium]|nr:DUF2298 domain-containing protein [Anaerolineae bacterium]